MQYVIPALVEELVRRFRFLTERPLLSTAVIAFGFVFGTPAVYVRKGQEWVFPLMGVIAIISVWLFKHASDRSKSISENSVFKDDYYLKLVDVPRWLSLAQAFVAVFLLVFVLWSAVLDAVTVWSWFSGWAAPS